MDVNTTLRKPNEVEFDPFISTYIASRGNQGKGHVSYLSSTICDECIELLGSRVVQEIVKEVKKKEILFYNC